MPDVFFFGNGAAEGGAHMKDILGGKGANLAEMTNIGVPVPPGFTISAKLCSRYLKDRRLPDGLKDEVRTAMQRLEEATGRTFGSATAPLLVSVRSGAAVSMPGMMDTILNLGLNDETARGLAEQSDNPAFAYDSYRRFVQMYADVVFDIKAHAGEQDPFEAANEAMKREHDVSREVDLPTEALETLVERFKSLVERATGAPFPTDPWDQLWGAVEAVFRSWQTKRAIEYRRVHRIPDDLGTAVSVVAMVYGNMGEDSGTGVCFTRNPSTGEHGIFGEFLVNAQGEDVVAGTRDPEPIHKMAERLPESFHQLEETCARLERHFRDMQDIEFTVESGTLYLLQTRTGKRTGHAAVRIAVEMVDEGLINQAEGLQRVDPDQINQILHPTVDPNEQVTVLARGLPASPGAAVGRAVFDADVAAERGAKGEPVILIRRETSPDDFHGMAAAQAILTARGGMTSHAAVVARGMGKCCVAGAKDLDVDEAARAFEVDGQRVVEGDWLTLDGSTGAVILGKARLVEPTPTEHFTRLMTWADETRLLRVRTNADTPTDARRAREFGAEGIGLCRTEHMFFDGARLNTMREMIVATDIEGRRRALLKLLPIQREDFVGIFEAMDGLPVTIRLLDPPLHEFLPHDDAEIAALAETLDVPLERMRHTVEVLTESNPMLGHRGCRLGLTYPEITEMQAQAIFEAACQAAEAGVAVFPEVMVPLVADVEELNRQAALVRATAERVFTERKRHVGYLVGTMIELPRAALTAGRIAGVAEFFSFGTNDLTQTTFGLSRDDAGRFLPFYVDTGILSDDPFQTLDQAGVGRLIEIAVHDGRAKNPKLKIGICGEHGGDPRSVAFCHRAGFNYVSCSPFRVPVARLAAAQAALADGGA
ncbi:MAG TPA: pyruvate, phosphate dikinase [Gemmatimonadales bacterium]|nr:pyruvate, phosphate dikinase [Gemmatimonadales bacterium]